MRERSVMTMVIDAFDRSRSIDLSDRLNPAWRGDRGVHGMVWHALHHLAGLTQNRHVMLTGRAGGMFLTPAVLRGETAGNRMEISLIYTILKTSHTKQAPLPARKFGKLENLPPAPSEGERASIAPMPCTD